MLRIFAIALLAVASTALSEERPDPGKEAYRRGYQLVLEEDWEAAITVLDSVTRMHKSDLVDDALFWKCHVLEREGRKQEAFDCYRKLIRQHSHSKWADDAKQSLVQLGSELSLDGKHDYSAFIDSVAQNLEDEIALTALYALTNTQDERGLDAAAGLIKQTQDTRIKRRLARLISQYGSLRAFTVLRDVAETETDLRTRSSAIVAMSQMRRERLDENTLEAIRAYVESVVFGDYPRRMQSGALRARLDIGASGMAPGEWDPGAGDFLELVGRTHSDRRIRSDAVNMFAQHYPERALLLLEQLTSGSGHPDLGRQVVRLLAGLADGAGLDKLIEIAEGHPNVTVRKEAIQALQHSNDPKAKDALLRLATKPLNK